MSLYSHLLNIKRVKRWWYTFCTIVCFHIKITKPKYKRLKYIHLLIFLNKSTYIYYIDSLAKLNLDSYKETIYTHIEIEVYITQSVRLKKKKQKNI